MICQGFLYVLRCILRWKYKNFKTNKLRDAKEEGKKEKQNDIARKMLKRNMSIEDIIELTGLTQEELEKLK